MKTKTVLVIDDNEGMLKLVSEYLRILGIEPVTAGDPKTGLELARKRKPDAILLDIMMPGMSGNEVAGKLKADPETAGIPVIFLTALVEKEDAIRGTRGGHFFISKDLSPKEFMDTLQDLLKGPRG
jgi:two-component system phosphate regulon response regulator PhoB